MQQTQVTVGASSNIGTYLLQPYIKAFLETELSPCEVEVMIRQNPVVAEKVENGEVDVAVMEWWDGRSGCNAALWRREELVIIVPPDHSWAGMSAIPASLLTEAPMLGGEPGTGTGRLLTRYLGDAVESMKPAMNLGSTEAVKQWVKAGLGVSLVLAGTVEQERRDGSLCVIPLEGEPICKELYVIWRDSLSPQNLSRRFAERLLAENAA